MQGRRTFISGWALALALLLAACRPPVRPSLEGDPAQVARAYLDAWAQGDLAAQADALVEVPPDLEAQHARWRQGLGVVASRFDRLWVLRETPQAAEVAFRALHTLRGLGEWELEGRLALERDGERWRVRWSPAVLHPLARAGDGFARLRSWGPRGDLLDAQGAPLTVPGEVITIGVDPRRVREPAAVTRALQEQLGVEPRRVEAALGSRADFVGLIDVRPERYARVRAALAPVPGIFFRRRAARLSPAEGFAAHTLGRVGEATAEALAALGAPYQAGDVVGLSGLERTLERTLAGRPTGELRLVRASGERVVLARLEGEPGSSVRTTLQRDVQAAAEAALEGVLQPAALAAVDLRTGEVRALASRPLAEPLHRALSGSYPPGSTFKVVTAEALLAAGLTPQAPASCPTQVLAGGKRFRNFESESLGDTTLRQAFAHSCNTAFVLLGARLSPDALEEAAGRFGFGARYEVGLPSAGARFPEPTDAAERAAAAIGQGRVLATPLHMATVAAAVGEGTWRAPRLLADADAGPTSASRREAPGPCAS
ncbi:MAG TPA: penicillin-binding transpeptidase domain-containing protein [Aggregicoccus sp.]|nr:penicillin-binding transpeptidase domain-containing protein [Aggregicoccus sp.]